MSYKATYFANHYADTALPVPMVWETLDEVVKYLNGVRCPVKGNKTPLIKLASFSGPRCDATVGEFYGATGDFDAGEMIVEDARVLFEAMGIEVLLHATHSEGIKPGHSWRAHAWFSKPLDDAEFHEQTSKLNGVLAPLGVSLGAESWDRSRAYYIGSDHPVLISRGQPVDLVDGIGLADASGGRKARVEAEPPVAAVPYQGHTSPADAEKRKLLLDMIRNAQTGHRRNHLWGATKGLYRLVSGGRIDPEGLEDAVRAAALEVMGEEEILDNIASGIRAGMADPLTVERQAAENKAYWEGQASPLPDEVPRPPAGCVLVPNDVHEAHEDAAKRRAEQMALAAAIGEGLGDDAPLPVIMTVDEMLARLVSVGGTHVADKKTGRIRGVEAAAREYAASIHNWEDDGKPKSAPAIKIWQQRHTRLTVDGLTWQPGQPELCTLPEATEAGSRGLNTWRGLPPLPKPENWEELAQPFVEHVAYLVPAEAERHRFLQWLAHMVQRPEELPHTCYLFVTPSFGIGRGWLAGVLARVMRGHAAIGVDLAQTLLGSFNGRLSRKLIAIVEEVREGAGTNRYTLANKFRDEITGEVRHINPKFGLQSVEKNCLRWLIFSQHLDAVPFDEGDRRVIVIANPEKGKDAGYYSRIYGLLNNRDFAGAVRHYLATYDLTGFNPGEHAPLNAAKREAAESMLSPVDVAVREYLDECDKPLIAVSAIRAHVILSGTSGISDTHFRHALQRAGIGKGRRIRMEDGRRETVAARRGGGWTVEMVNAAAPEALRALL